MVIGDEQQGLERDFPLGDEVRLGERTVLVAGDGLVELVVLGVLDVGGFPGPDGFGLIAHGDDTRVCKRSLSIRI